MGKRRSNKKFFRSLVDNAVVENYYVSLLYNLYTSAYKWEGLPDYIPSQFIEESLISKGCVFFTEEPELGLIGLPAAAASNLSPFGVPYRWRMFGRDGSTIEVDNRDGVYCYNTQNKQSDLTIIYMFAKRLALVTRSMDVNIHHQRHPGVIRTNENNRLSYEQVMLDYDSGIPDIVVDKDLDLNAFQHINYGIPFTADKLQYTARDILSDAINYIGVQYSSSNKKERLASTEIDSNIGYTAACRMLHLTPRQWCAEMLSKRYDMDITVDINDGFVNMLKIADINPNNEQMAGESMPNSIGLYGSSSGERQVR